MKKFTLLFSAFIFVRIENNVWCKVSCSRSLHGRDEKIGDVDGLWRCVVTLRRKQGKCNGVVDIERCKNGLVVLVSFLISCLVS